MYFILLPLVHHRVFETVLHVFFTLEPMVTEQLLSGTLLVIMEDGKETWPIMCWCLMFIGEITYATFFHISLAKKKKKCYTTKPAIKDWEIKSFPKEGYQTFVSNLS